MEVTALTKQIIAVLEEQGVPRSEAQAAPFAQAILQAERWSEYWKKLLKVPQRLEAMDILRWISEVQRSGDLDEALWRGFLAGHFGRPSAGLREPEKIMSAGWFLCGFSATPIWTWDRVSSDCRGFEAWLQSHQMDLKTLQFGNHRKYESKRPEKLFEVISSFVAWVKSNGGTPRQAFAADGSDDPWARFDTLFHAMKGIQRFGRTARFDTLCLLGNLELVSVIPGSCYLDGATGPLRGAEKLWGKYAVSRLTSLADQTAQYLDVPMEVFEDALCNWQK